MNDGNIIGTIFPYIWRPEYERGDVLKGVCEKRISYSQYLDIDQVIIWLCTPPQWIWKETIKMSWKFEGNYIQLEGKGVGFTALFICGPHNFIILKLIGQTNNHKLNCEF